VISSVSSIALPESQPSQISRTIEWCKKKAEAEGRIPGNKEAWKTCTCPVCKKPMTSGSHTQFRGQRTALMNLDKSHETSGQKKRRP